MGRTAGNLKIVEIRILVDPGTSYIGLNPGFVSFHVRFGMFAQEIFRFGPIYFPTTYQCPYHESKEIILAVVEKTIEFVTDKNNSIKKCLFSQFSHITSIIIVNINGTK